MSSYGGMENWYRRWLWKMCKYIRIYKKCHLCLCICTNMRHICIRKPMANSSAASRASPTMVSIIHRWIPIIVPVSVRKSLCVWNLLGSMYHPNITLFIFSIYLVIKTGVVSIELLSGIPNYANYIKHQKCKACQICFAHVSFYSEFYMSNLFLRMYLDTYELWQFCPDDYHVPHTLHPSSCEGTRNAFFVFVKFGNLLHWPTEKLETDETVPDNII